MKALVSELTRASTAGVSDGARTRDTQDHNLVLYQLSYTHHGAHPAGGRKGNRDNDTGAGQRSDAVVVSAASVPVSPAASSSA